jgi:hypothetical protein
VVERARWDGCPAPGAPVSLRAVSVFLDPSIMATRWPPIRLAP